MPKKITKKEMIKTFFQFSQSKYINIQKHGNIGKLYISKKTSLPLKIEIIDNNNQSRIYIEYKEIKLNNIQKDNIFAFVTKDIRKEV